MSLRDAPRRSRVEKRISGDEDAPLNEAGCDDSEKREAGTRESAQKNQHRNEFQRGWYRRAGCQIREARCKVSHPKCRPVEVVGILHGRVEDEPPDVLVVRVDEGVTVGALVL